MASQPTRVLVVDDDPAFAQVMADLLMEKGFHVVATDDPDRALKAAEEGCDVAILDLKMPRIGGLELAALLKEKDPDIQVVILTGYGNMETAIEGIQHGVFDYIGKADIDMRRLERAVREASERARLTRTNRELVAQLTESNARLQALQEVSTALSGEPHQDRVLESLARAARELSGSATARAILFGPSHSDDIVIEAAAGDGAETLVGVRLQPGEGIAARAAAVRPHGVGDRPRRGIPDTRAAATRCRPCCPASSPRPSGREPSGARWSWPGARGERSRSKTRRC